MNNAQKKILVAISKTGSANPIIVDESVRKTFEYDGSPWYVETYVLETDVDRLLNEKKDKVWEMRHSFYEALFQLWKRTKEPGYSNAIRGQLAELSELIRSDDETFLDKEDK